MVLNGARMGRASSVALGGAVHIGCVVPPRPGSRSGGWPLAIRLARTPLATPATSGLDWKKLAASCLSCSAPIRPMTAASKRAPPCAVTPASCPVLTRATSQSASTDPRSPRGASARARRPSRDGQPICRVPSGSAAPSPRCKSGQCMPRTTPLHLGVGMPRPEGCMNIHAEL